MNLRFHYGILLEDFGGQNAGAIAAHQDLHGMLLHLAANTTDLAFGYYIAVAQQDHLV